jgi:hypothetical protein
MAQRKLYMSSLPGVKGLLHEADHVRSRPRLRKSGTVPALPQYVFMACRETALPFAFLLYTLLAFLRAYRMLFAKYLSTRKMICAKVTEKNSCT